MAPMTVEAAIAEADTRIRTDPAFAHTEHLLVVHDGTYRAELSYGRRGADQPGDIFSITKSVLATLVGCACRDGRLNIDTPLGRFLPADAPEQRAQVCLRHLLTMTAGADTSGPFDIDHIMTRPSGWITELLRAPMLATPGERFSYDNGATHLLAACLQTAVGDDLERYARRALFDPLGIRRWDWPRDPDGLPYGFGHLHLSPRDLVLLGRLWLDQGTADGRRLMSAGYVAEATTAHSPGGPPEHTGYGYLWWITSVSGFDAYLAGGYAGQHLLVVPALKTIIVTTGSIALLRPGWRPAVHLTAPIIEAIAGEGP